MSEHPTIIAAYAEWASGPGWRNQPLWIITRDAGGTLREECLQPEEWCHSPEIGAMYATSDAMNVAMVAAVRRLRRGK